MTFTIPEYAELTAFHLAGLPVGHTHEDIDQAFSVISRALLGGPKRDREVTLNTREELVAFLTTKVLISRSVSAHRLTRMFRHVLLLGFSKGPQSSQATDRSLQCRRILRWHNQPSSPRAWSQWVGYMGRQKKSHPLHPVPSRWFVLLCRMSDYQD